MGTRAQTFSKGFSLIEVILFLGITGLIMSVLLVGIGAGLNQQKYRDSTSSLISHVQNQYNLVTNVNNSRPSTTVCAGGSITQDDAPGPAAGMSNCTIVGRLLQSSPDGTAINESQVISTVDPTSLPVNANDTDIKILRDAAMIASPNTEQFTPSWGARLVAPSSGALATFSILIVRMPTSGVIHTYASTTAGLSPAEIIAQIPAPITDVKLCLSPEGLLGNSTQPAGVQISANAGNSSGVSFVQQGDC